MPDLPEPWLRGPVRGVPALLQPAAHAFLMAGEDVASALDAITEEELWMEPSGITSLGFHLAHLAGSTDRLLTYARGEALSTAQRATLDRERTLSQERPALERLLAAWHDTVVASLRHLSSMSDLELGEPRHVGRAHLPSTVLGLLFHAAEHASRHTGQIVTTAKLVRALR
jgi:uncharacterized damage-inducible protein DinB